MSSVETKPSATERKAPARRSLSGTLSATALAGVLLFAACEGDNLFSGGSAGRVGSGAPKVGSVTPTPSPVGEGQRLDVRVKAIAPAGMERVTVRFRRAVVDDQSFPISGNRTDTVTVDASINIPAPVSDSILIVEAFATDRLGRVSDVVATTVRIESRTAPQVTVTVSPSGNVPIGDTLRIRVSARDNFGLQQLGYMVVGSQGDTLRGPSFVVVNGVARDTLFLVTLPAGVQAGSVSVVGLAINSQQLRGVSSPLALNLVDLAGPQVDILMPQLDEPVPLADSLLVRVRVTDSNGIAEVRLRGVAIRRDSLQNTVVVERFRERIVPFPQPPSTVLPTDTVIQRFLLPAADTTSEPVYIIVSARDRGGNTSADTVRVIDGPRIMIITPTPGTLVGLNSLLLVRINASDRIAGLDSLKLIVTGVQQQTVTVRGLAPLTSVDTTITLNTGSVTGSLTLQPGVWNRRGIGGFAQPVTVTVASTAVSDTMLPRVARTVQTNERIELDDSIRITVRATDGSGSGVRRMGIVVRLIPDTDLLTPRQILRTTESFDPPLSGIPERVFSVSLNEVIGVNETDFPRKFTIQVHAFAVDAAGNCGASVSTSLSAVACEQITDNGVDYFAARGQIPAAVTVTAVQGQSVNLPGGGRIADAVVDANRRRIYLSNISNNRVDIFHIGADTFDITGPRPGACAPTGSGIASCRGVVGAAPWGLFINNRGDSLIVANSGGTNISMLPLDGADYMREHVSRRVLTPNEVLWEVTQTVTETGVRYSTKFYDFSDRPQYVAQHAMGFLLYSTLPTPAARDGTIRVADTDPDPTSTTDMPESRILVSSGARQQAEDSWAISGLDSIKIVRGTSRDSVVLYDHKPGYYSIPGTPGQLIESDVLPFADAVADIVAKGSDLEIGAGQWNPSAFALSDTTFLAASTDRTRIAVGEGVRAPARIYMCCEVSGPPLSVSISNGIQVTDLVNNASERVFGLGLNQNGTLGVARGAQATYFFTPDLRLQGEFRTGIAGGTGGAALHPDHASALETGDRALAFAATPNRTIKIIDATHFYERGEIAIRDNVVGPLRAVLPDASENPVPSTHPDYIVIKLVAVTAGDNVVIVNVRRRDIGG